MQPKFDLSRALAASTPLVRMQFVSTLQDQGALQVIRILLPFLERDTRIRFRIWFGKGWHSKQVPNVSGLLKDLEGKRFNELQLTDGKNVKSQINRPCAPIKEIFASFQVSPSSTIWAELSDDAPLGAADARRATYDSLRQLVSNRNIHSYPQLLEMYICLPFSDPPDQLHFAFDLFASAIQEVEPKVLQFACGDLNGRGENVLLQKVRRGVPLGSVEYWQDGIHDFVLVPKEQLSRNPQYSDSHVAQSRECGGERIMLLLRRTDLMTSQSR